MNPAIPASGGAGAADGIDSDDSISQSGFSGVGRPEAAAGRAGANESSKTEGAAAQFECNVCLETASEPVITRCGHLFW